MSGPRPLDGKTFAERHASADRGSYRVLKVLAPRRFRVTCLDCGSPRVVEYKHGNLGPKCRCKCRYKFKGVKRTAKSHTEEIQDRGYTEYKCLAVTDDLKRSYTYRHSCGTKFSMTKDCFFACLASPCPKCRPTSSLTAAEFYSKVQPRLTNVELLSSFISMKEDLTVRFISCGCVTKLSPCGLQRRRVETLNKCPICYPNRVWFRFTVCGKEFQTRSLVEKAFVQWLVTERGVPVSAIDYEPLQIPYYNPRTGHQSRYAPDFKVGSTYVEVKDGWSLGLLGDYRGIPQQDVLIENRAKAEAASRACRDYRIYTLVGGNFIRTEKFWQAKEKKRILSHRP